MGRRALWWSEEIPVAPLDGLDPFLASLLLGAAAGLLGTLAMTLFEYPAYISRGVRGVPDYVLGRALTTRVLGERRGGALRVVILSHFNDGLLMGVIFAFLWPRVAGIPFYLVGGAIGVFLFAFSTPLYRVLVGHWLWAQPRGRRLLALHFATHTTFGLVVATILHWAT